MKTDGTSVKGYSLKDVCNENETRVCKKMEEIIDREEFSNICLCGLCLEDIYGIVLNKLPPQYRHSSSIKLSKGKIKENALETAIVAAIKKVNKKPKHN